MRVDWAVLCESATISEITGRADIQGAGIWQLRAPSLPVQLDFHVVVRLVDLPALVDEPARYAQVTSRSVV